MKTFASHVLCLAFALCASSALAGETVKSPNVDQGQLEFEQKGRLTTDDVTLRDDVEVNVGYGVTDNWKAKIESTFDEDKAGNMVYRRTKFENALQLTKVKDGWFANTALYNDFSFSDRTDTSHDVTFGVLAQKDLGNFINTGNLFVKKDFGDTAVAGINLIYRWQTRYNLMQELQPGFEILGDTRKKDAFRDQLLHMGPGIYGSMGLDRWGGSKNQKIGYDLVYTFGATPVTPDGNFKWKVKYSYQF